MPQSRGLLCRLDRDDADHLVGRVRADRSASAARSYGSGGQVCEVGGGAPVDLGDRVGIVLTALTTLGLSGAPVHEPVHDEARLIDHPVTVRNTAENGREQLLFRVTATGWAAADRAADGSLWCEVTKGPCLGCARVGIA